MTFTAGEKLTADKLNGTTDIAARMGTNTSTEGSGATTASTSFTDALTGGTPASNFGCSFTALASGVALVFNSANLKNSTTNFSSCSFELRTGSIIGSGSVVLAASDVFALGCRGTDEQQMTRVKTLTGLTPGTVYHVRQMYRVNTASTFTALRREITVVPL